MKKKKTLAKWKRRNGKYHIAPVCSGYSLSNVNWMHVDLSRKSLNRVSEGKRMWLKTHKIVIIVKHYE